MSQHYDAIVIGAGLGGLSSATYLAKNGLKTLLLERHVIPGGYATSFVRGRYEFEVALHELSGIGPPERRGLLYKYLDYLGVAEKVEFLPIHELYRSIFPDLDVTLPVGAEACETKLCDTFPDDAKGIRAFLNKCHTLSHEIQAFSSKQGIGNPLTVPFRFATTIRYLTASWGKVLNRDVKDKHARAVLSQFWGYLGLGPSALSFLYMAGALSSYIKLGPYYVKGRSQALSNAFVNTFEKYGGDVRFKCGVKKITTKNGKVTGVITEKDDVYTADYIVSNADPVSTCRSLISAEHVPASFFQGLRASSVAPSTMNVYMGIACPPEELGLGCHENFINVDYEVDRHAAMTQELKKPGVTLLTCYNPTYKEVSPPGTSLVVLTTLYHGEPWFKVSPNAYVEKKNQLAEEMLQAAETVSPNLRKYAEVVEVATPLTNIRYAAALGGSIYGFNNTTYDHTVFRMGQKGPLERLYFAGAWTSPGGGFEPCMISGQMAGEMVLKHSKKAVKEH